MTSVPASGRQHVLRHGDAVAVIASVGASLRSFSDGGRDLVVPFAEGEPRPRYRGATLAPWPNRVVDGRYVFGGVAHRLPLTEPDRGHALHGLVAWLDFSPSEWSADRVVLGATVEPQQGYPWRLRVETSYELSAAGLRQTVWAQNCSEAPAPFGAGPHPYLVAGPGSVDDWTLELPASRVLGVTDDRLAPTVLGPVSEALDFREPRRIGGTRIDHAFTDLARDDDRIATVRLTTADGDGVAMSWDEGCRWVQIHTADTPEEPGSHRVGLAVEPMSCAPDAFNADRYPFDTGLRVLAPGELVSLSWTIHPITVGR